MASRQNLLHYALFPGMVFHELSHYIACIFCGVKVRKVKFFGTEEAYVAHEQPNAWKSIIITLAPFVLGNFFALLLLNAANEMLSEFNIFVIIYYWFAFALILYSFPSIQDAKNSFSTLINFYSKAILRGKKASMRIFWLITFPFVFIPLVLLLGLMLLFNYAFAFRIIWLAFVLLSAYNPGIIAALFSITDVALMGIAKALAGQ